MSLLDRYLKRDAVPEIEKPETADTPAVSESDIHTIKVAVMHPKSFVYLPDCSVSIRPEGGEGKDFLRGVTGPTGEVTFTENISLFTEGSVDIYVGEYKVAAGVSGDEHTGVLTFKILFDEEAEAAKVLKENLEKEQKASQRRQDEERHEQKSKNVTGVFNSMRTGVIVAVILLAFLALAATLYFNSGGDAHLAPIESVDAVESLPALPVPEMSPISDGLLACQRVPATDIQLFEDRQLTKPSAVAKAGVPHVIFPMETGNVLLVVTDIGVRWVSTSAFMPEYISGTGSLSNGQLPASCTITAPALFPEVTSSMDSIVPAESVASIARRLAPWLALWFPIILTFAGLGLMIELFMHNRWLVLFLGVGYWVVNINWVYPILYKIDAPLELFQALSFLGVYSMLMLGNKGVKGELETALQAINLGESGSGKAIDEFLDRGKNLAVKVLGSVEWSDIMIFIVPSLALIWIKPENTLYTRLSTEMSPVAFISVFVVMPYLVSVILENMSRAVHSDKQGSWHMVMVIVATICGVGVAIAAIFSPDMASSQYGVFAIIGVVLVFDVVLPALLGVAAMRMSGVDVPVQQMDVIPDYIVNACSSSLATLLVWVLVVLR